MLARLARPVMPGVEPSAAIVAALWLVRVLVQAQVHYPSRSPP
jgi:hypothetical protein